MSETEPPEGFGSVIPLETLSALHDRGGRYRADRMDNNLADQLTKIELPTIGKQAVGPLFNGTLFFARILFTVESQNNAVISVQRC